MISLVRWGIKLQRIQSVSGGIESRDEGEDPEERGPGINGSRALSCALLHARDRTCGVAYIVSIINLQKSKLCLLNETFNKIRARAAIDIVGPILAPVRSCSIYQYVIFSIKFFYRFLFYLFIYFIRGQERAT